MHRLLAVLYMHGPVFVRPVYECLVTNLRDQLGEERVRVLREQGEKLTLDEVLATGE